MSVGKKYVTKDDLEAFARKLSRRVGGVRYGGGAGAGHSPVIVGEDHEITVEVSSNKISLGVDPQLEITSAGEQPYVKITNASDVERDPVNQWAVGETPETKFTAGVDDSDSDMWLLCSGALLSKYVAPDSYWALMDWTGFIAVIDHGNNRVRIHGASDLAPVYSAGSVGSGDDNFNLPRDICSDGEYVYICDFFNSRIVKRRVSDLAFVAKASSGGTGLDYTDPLYIDTDGTYIYFWCNCLSGGKKVFKLKNSDLSYVAHFNCTNDGWGNSAPATVCTDGRYLYLEANGGASYRICKVLCSTMEMVDRWYPGDSEGHLTSAYASEGSFIWKGYWYIGGSAANTYKIFKFNTTLMTYVSESANMFGAGDGQVTYGLTMKTDGTHIYIGEGNLNLAANRIQKFLLSDYSFVAKWGTYGNDDAHINMPYVCPIGSYGEVSHDPANYPILGASVLGDWVDSYPVHRFRDGIRIMEAGVVDATDYIEINSPAAITAPYTLTLPAAVPAAASSVAVSSAGVISWGQDLSPAAGPSFNHVHLTAIVGNVPMVVTSTTVVGNLNADLLDGNHSTAFAAASHNHDSAYISIIASPAANHFPYQTVGGELIDSTYDASDFAAAAHGHALGDLSDVSAAAPNDEDVLTWDAGTSTWVAAPPGAAALAFLDLTDTPAAYTGAGGYFVKVTADASALEFVASSVSDHALSSASHTDVDASAPSDNDILRFDTASGKWKNEALPAAANHDLLSATHEDTVASAVSRGSLIVGDASSNPKWAELAVGEDGQVLTTDGLDVFWADPTGGEGGGAPTDASYIVEDANAGLSAEVVLGASVITTAAYASRQAAAKAGRIFLPSDGFYVERDTGAAWGSWGPIFKCAPPVLADLTWVNQGAAKATTTNGGIHLWSPIEAAVNWRLLCKTAPATPYTFTVMFLPLLVGGNYHAAGIIHRANGSGKFINFAIMYANGWGLYIQNMNSPTSWNANVAIVLPQYAGGLLWLRIADNGTNRIFSISYDGINFMQILSQGRTTFCTADEIGIGVNCQNAAYGCGATYLSWLET